MRTLLIVGHMLLACGAAQAAAPVDLDPLALVGDLPAGSPQAPPADDLVGSLAMPATLPADAPLPDAPGGAWSPADLPPPAVAATAAGGAALVLVGFALYSRLARHELMDHERREAVLQLIRDSPGIPLTDIATKLGLAWGTAVYHLERMERAGFIASEKSAGRRCYFAVGALPRETRASLGTLQQETTRDVAAFVAARPGATQSELCEGLGLSASAASKQVSKLESAGLVRREREWKTVKLHPAPQLAELLTA